jgi:hypothetical protein
MGDEYVIACNNGALCNVIKCMLSSLRLCDIHNRSLKVIWMQNKNKINCDFADIFENDFEIVRHLCFKQLRNFNFGTSIRYDSSRLYIHEDDDIVDNFSTISHDLTGKRYRDFDQFNGKVIEHEYRRIPTELQDVYRKYIDKLIVKKEILKEVEDFMIENDLWGNEYTAVHIRTWNYKSLNHTPREAQRRKTVNIDLIIEQIIAIEGRLFVCTDNQSLIERLRTKKPDICFRRLKHSDNPMAIDGFIDMMIASHASKLYLTLHSTFSEMIWWFNKNNPEVNLI